MDEYFIEKNKTSIGKKQQDNFNKKNAMYRVLKEPDKRGKDKGKKRERDMDIIPEGKVSFFYKKSCSDIV